MYKNNNDSKFAFAFLILVLLALLFFSSMRMVPVGHVGVVMSFGRITGTSLEPGLHFTAPWHFVKRIDNRVKHTETTTPCFSKDLQLLEIDLDIMTVLPKDKAAMVYANIGTEYLEQVKPRVYELLKQEVSKYTAELVIENRGKIHQDVLLAARSRMEDLVRFEDIVLTNIDFSDAYEKAIEQKQVSQQRSLQAKYELEKAKIEAEKEIATAQGEAESIRIKGDALKSSPGMAILEAIKKWNGYVPHTLMIGTEIPAVFPVQ